MLFNVALVEKWKWKLGIESKGLFKNIVESKYGSWRKLNYTKSTKGES